MATGTYDLVFDGEINYVEIADSPDLSVATTGKLSVAAWMRPDVLTFPISESTGYVHWMGKGEHGQREWVFRMYNETTTDPTPRPNRISFYVFNLSGGEGIGSYVQEPVQTGEWIHIVGVADGATTSIYKNGEFKRCDRYTGTGPGPCHNYPASEWITPERGSSPMRIGTRDFVSYFLGAVREVRVWNRALMGAEVTALYGGSVPQNGLMAEYLLTQDVAVDSMGRHNGVIAGATWIAS
jgi:hypothetical protein